MFPMSINLKLIQEYISSFLSDEGERIFKTKKLSVYITSFVYTNFSFMHLKNDTLECINTSK